MFFKQTNKVNPEKLNVSNNFSNNYIIQNINLEEIFDLPDLNHKSKTKLSRITIMVWLYPSSNTQNWLPTSFLNCISLCIPTRFRIKDNSNLFISSTIVHLTYFIDHSPSLSYLPYLVIPMLYVTRPYFHVRLRNQILIKYIHSWADIKTYGSKPNFTNITCSACQSKNFGSSDQAIP